MIIYLKIQNLLMSKYLNSRGIMFKFSLCFLLLSLITSTSYAQKSCANYEYKEGIEITSVAGGYKILSTASASVSMDDIDSIKDAKEEATLEAKAAIAKFFSEDIKSDSKIDKVVKETKQSDGSSLSINRQELIIRVKSLRNASQSLIRGALDLGSCYTKGREYRVTLGIKPETIKTAEQLSKSLNNSGSYTEQVPNSNLPLQRSMRDVDGFSDSDRVKKF